MISKFDFDPNKAYGPANEIARDQEVHSRLLLWDWISDKAATNEQFRQELAKNPTKVIEQEASALRSATGQQVEINSVTVDQLAEKAKKTYSNFAPGISQDKVEDLIFGTIEDMRTSFKLVLRLSQVLFYFGIAMVIAAFLVALAGQGQTLALLFGAGGIANILLSSLVLSPLNRVQDAACDLVQLQMAYLAYYKQLYLLGNDKESITKNDAVTYAREINRAAISIISSIKSKADNNSKVLSPAQHSKSNEK